MDVFEGQSLIMKILNVCDIMNPLYGGSVERSYQISFQLNNLGHEVDLLTTKWKLDKDYIKGIKGSKTFILKAIALRTGINPNLIPLGLNKWINSNLDNYDVIHISRNWSLLSSFIAIKAHQKGIPYVYSPMGFVSIINGSKLLKKVYKKLFTIPNLMNASAILTVAKEESKDIVQLGIDSSKVHLIPNGVIPKDFSYKDDILFRDSNELDKRKIILFIGRMDPVKGVDILIDAFSEMKDIHQDWCLVLIGTKTSYRKEMIKKSSNLNMDKNIIFLDPIFGDSKSSAYHAADFIVIPSLVDAMTIIAPEAACCKKPVLYTNTCDFSELSENGGGIEVDPSVSSIKKGLTLMINSDRLGMGEKGYNYVIENYDWKNLAPQYLKVFKSVVRDINIAGSIK